MPYFAIEIISDPPNIEIDGILPIPEITGHLPAGYKGYHKSILSHTEAFRKGSERLEQIAAQLKEKFPTHGILLLLREIYEDDRECDTPLNKQRLINLEPTTLLPK